MKLVSFFEDVKLPRRINPSAEDLAKSKVGALSESGNIIVPLPFSTMISLMTDFASSKGFRFEELTRLVRDLERKGEGIPISDAQLLAPLPRPTSLRDAYAFRQHVETARKNRGLPMIPEFDQFPVFYFSNHLAITGPGPVAVQPLHLDHLDYELEIAAAIGRPGKNLTPQNADSHIFGFTVMNDWSARTLQMEEMKLNLGPAKGKDFATSIGPYLVTVDELQKNGQWQAGAHGHKLKAKMTAQINGQQHSSGQAEDMNWTFAQILARASYGVELQTGDVIGSGTVGTGCLLELNGSKITQDLWLQIGDEISMEVEGLGNLRNQVVAADL